jgi:ribonuclease Y
MSQLIIVLVVAIAAGMTGTALGWFLRFITALGRKGSAELEIKEMIISAREKAEKIAQEAKVTAENREQLSKEEIKKEEERIEKNEDRLARKESLLDQRQGDLDSEEEDLKKERKSISQKEEELREVLGKRKKQLADTTHLSEEEAKKELFDVIQNQYAEDLQVRIQKLERQNKDTLNIRAQNILATTIQRLANPVNNDVFSTVLHLKNEDVKGKIIGKEGRNIKAFEKETGVELIIDDAPNTLLISSFDPVRREVARKSLELLIEDGRIQPAKIERTIAKVKKDINEIIKAKGEEAAYEAKVFNLDPKVLLILGRLHFRTSYGQNVLQHSIEVAHLAGMMAEELGANSTTARAAGLVHDIGKAIDHEVTGTHVEIGRRILQKFGASEEIIKGMQAHHEEYPYETVESILVQVGDSISGGRPGARRDTVENYLQRLKDLENLAQSMPGVEKTYALQAGREIRVFVEPKKISDADAQILARDLAHQIENTLKYPGEVKVTVIRENKITEYAR